MTIPTADQPADQQIDDDGHTEASFRHNLTRHLDWFAERGLKARFWWRDDDAVEPTAALDRLLDLSDRHGVEVGLAVIPAAATRQLSERLETSPGAMVLQHGWQHLNHQRKDMGEKAAELGNRRDLDEAVADLQRGKERLEGLFPDRFIPALVPPWNRMTAGIARGARDLGLRGLSSFTWFHPPADHRLQTHIDMIKWKRGRKFIGWRSATLRYDLELCRRRTNPSEPIGLLSHHLVMDDASFDFLQISFEIITAHPGACCPPIRALFDLPK